MADPLSIFAIATTVVGGVAAAAGQAQQGAATADAKLYNADVDERNANVTRQQGRADYQAKRRENLKFAAETRAAYGSSGLAFDGSALDFFQDQAVEAERDARLITYEAEGKARGYEDSAALERKGAKAASSASYIGVIGEVARAGTSVAQLRRV